MTIVNDFRTVDNLEVFRQFKERVIHGSSCRHRSRKQNNSSIISRSSNIVWFRQINLAIEGEKSKIFVLEPTEAKKVSMYRPEYVVSNRVYKLASVCCIQTLLEARANHRSTHRRIRGRIHNNYEAIGTCQTFWCIGRNKRPF